MKRLFSTLAFMAVILFGIPVFAQDDKPAPTEADLEAMIKKAELIRARIEWRKQHMKAKAPAIKPQFVKPDTQSKDEAKPETAKPETSPAPKTEADNS